MSQFEEIELNFKVGTLYDPTIINDTTKSIEDILNISFIETNLPSLTSVAQYRSVKTCNMKLIKTSDSTSGAIPMIYLKRKDSSNERVKYVEVGIISGVDEYGTKVDSANSTGEEYYYVDATTQQIDFSISGLENYVISTIDYEADDFDWLSGNHGIPFTIKTNLPVFIVSDSFDTNNAMVKMFLKRELTAEQLLENYSEVLEIVNFASEKEAKTYYIYNEYKHGKTDLLNGFTPDANAVTFRKYEEIKVIGGELSLVRQSDGTYSIMNNGSEIVGSYYGTINNYTYTSYPGVIHETSGFVPYWNEQTISDSINCALLFDTNMYYYKSQADYDDIVSGRKTPEEVAENYDDVGTGKKPNPTGTKETKTELGKPTWYPSTINQWVLDAAKFAEIAIAIRNNDINPFGWMFTNPMDAIMDISWYPFDISRVANVHRKSFGIGTWAPEIWANAIKDVPNTLTMGSFEFAPTYNNYEDFYTQSVQIWLPYIGLKQLDIKRFMGKTLTVKYAFDFYTHQCTCFIEADGRMVDYYNGNIGATIPLSGTNFAEYGNAMLGLVTSVGTTAIAGGVLGSSAMGGVESLPMQVANTCNINNFRETKGSLSSMIGNYSPQYVFLIFEKLTSNDNIKDIKSLRGLPSNSSGSISSFSGFLSVSNVNLVCGGATETEKQEILSYLNNGIYI